MSTSSVQVAFPCHPRPHRFGSAFVVAPFPGLVRCHWPRLLLFVWPPRRPDTVCNGTVCALGVLDAVGKVWRSLPKSDKVEQSPTDSPTLASLLACLSLACRSPVHFPCILSIHPRVFPEILAHPLPIFFTATLPIAADPMLFYPQAPAQAPEAPFWVVGLSLVLSPVSRLLSPVFGGSPPLLSVCPLASINSPLTPLALRPCCRPLFPTLPYMPARSLWGTHFRG